ncbi:MAG: membrane protein insertion efficiency factor YidD [Acidobacteriota bacterium]
MKWRVPLPVLILAVVLLPAAGCVWHDLTVPAASQFSTRAAIAGIEQYRAHISPHLRGVIRCRFQPTCSVYGLASVKKYGGIRGGWRAIKRVARCNPWTPPGTIDPP